MVKDCVHTMISMGYINIRTFCKILDCAMEILHSISVFHVYFLSHGKNYFMHVQW